MYNIADQQQVRSWYAAQQQAEGGQQNLDALLGAQDRQRTNHRSHRSRHTQLLDAFIEIFWTNAVEDHSPFTRVIAQYARPLQPLLADCCQFGSALQRPGERGKPLRRENIRYQVAAPYAHYRGNAEQPRRVDRRKARDGRVERLHQLVTPHSRQFEQRVVHLDPALPVQFAPNPRRDAVERETIQQRRKRSDAVAALWTKRRHFVIAQHQDIDLHTTLHQSTSDAHD